MQRRLFFLLILLSVWMAACSKVDQIEPDEMLQEYINYWEEQAFDQMYRLLSSETKEKYSEEDFVNRYEKIYRDLEIEDVTIYIMSSKELAASERSYKLHIQMNSIAGPIDFSREISLSSFFDEEKQVDSWLVNWDPGFIFPDLAEGGKIKIEKINPSRGEILDRNEMPLAINDLAYQVGVVPNQFVNKDIEIEQLSRLLKISRQSIEKQLDAEWVQDEHFVPLRILPKSDSATINQLKTIPAVVLKETEGRTYPSSKAISHLIGYIGKITDDELKKYKQYEEDDLIGKRGLEKLFEARLKGEQGVKVLIESKDEKGDSMYKTLAEKPVVDGEKIQLTIDINLQELLYEQYEGSLKGAAAAIHPKTGEVLALVSSPSFDPLRLSYGISQAEWEQLMNDKQRPFVNRFTAKFAPGSVIKPVVGAIGLANQSITHEEGITINGLTWKKDNWENFHVTRVSTSHKPVTLEDALIRSDNIYFAMKAVSMGNDKFLKGLKAYGFGEAIPIDFPFEKSQISNSGDLKNEALRANTAYGQGEIEVNVLHMALLYSPILNDGHMVKPILLKSDKKEQVWKKDLINKEDQKKLKQYLRKVVTEGTATVIKDEPIEISGKTGTVELKVSRDSRGHENGWFVGYPSKDEDLIIAMLIEEVEHRGTSSFVAKKVADVMSQYKSLNK